MRSASRSSPSIRSPSHESASDQDTSVQNRKQGVSTDHLGMLGAVHDPNLVVGEIPVAKAVPVEVVDELKVDPLGDSGDRPISSIGCRCGATRGSP
jgi:hypothetical protein